MTLTDNIQYRVQNLPMPLQQEVLDFVEYLMFKREQEAIHEQDESGWSGLSLDTAMRGMENEDSPIYSLEDLQEAFS